jgi:TPR repeat protein/serine/threonine protein kinase
MSGQIETDWPRNALPAETVLHGFRVVGILGRGGFGITYKAVDQIDQLFAVKECFPRQFAIRDGCMVRAASAADATVFAQCLDRFTREARALTLFSHDAAGSDGVVKVLTYFKGNGTAYIVMEFLEGQPLDDMIAAHPGGLPEPVLAGLLRTLLPALAQVHGANLLHRDIKPANIFVRRNGRPVLLDFGAARARQTGGEQFTQIYTETYAPIEQIEGLEQGAFSDIYSLAMSFYQAIAGSRFDQATSTATRRRMAALTSTRDPLPPATVIGAGRYSASLLAGIDAALRVAPEERPKDVRAFMAALGMSDLAEQTRVAAPGAQPAEPPTRVAGSPGGPSGAVLPETVIGPSLSPGRPRGPASSFTPTVLAGKATPAAKSTSGAMIAVIAVVVAALAAGGGAWLVVARSTKPVETPPPVAAVPAQPPAPAAPLQPPAAQSAEIRPPASQGVPGPPRATPQPGERADDLYARRDYANAFAKYQQEAEQGDRHAQYLVGYMYQNGQGVPPDSARALSWYRKAADQGDATAETQIGFLYQNGIGVSRDLVVAAEWYAKAAADGSRDGQYQYAYVNQHGFGVPRNYPAALRWYRAAADQGSPGAEQQLGYMYQMGLGVTKDYRESAGWYRRAAEHGLPAAQFSLGNVYAQGLGVPRDMTAAREWISRAAAAGNPEAKAWLDTH